MAALATLPVIIPLVTAGISAVGTIAAGRAAAAQGEASQKAANFQAAQLDIKAKDEQAAAQVEAREARIKKERVLSTLQARSAGSGFSATDPTSLALADEIERFGTLQEQLAQFGGKSRRTGLEAQADAARFSGQASSLAGQGAQTGSFIKAAGTLAGGGASAFDRFDKQKRAGVSSG